MHTNDAPSAVTRLLEMGIEPYLAASSIECVIAQRLVRRVCKPCEDCQGTGYYGRTTLYEIMPVHEPIRELILQKEPGSRIRKEALAGGMTGLFETGMAKVKKGVTDVDEIRRVISQEI